MGKGTSGSGGKTPWSKIATGKGGKKSPADGFTKGKFGKGKSTAKKGGKKGK